MAYRRKKRSEFHLVYDKEKKHITPKMIREVISWVFYTVVAVIIASMTIFAFGSKVLVVGDSMADTLESGQYVLINRISGYLTGPGRGDVIAFLPNGNTNAYYYVKRVVGLPGETVQIRDGVLYIDGLAMTEDARAFGQMDDAGMAENPIKLGKDEYFVLGDSRNNSEDSRTANIGVVKSSMIYGKAWYAYGGQNKKSGFVHDSY